MRRVKRPSPEGGRDIRGEELTISLLSTTGSGPAERLTRFFAFYPKDVLLHPVSHSLRLLVYQQARQATCVETKVVPYC
jgi:hypothetical protein